MTKNQQEVGKKDMGKPEISFLQDDFEYQPPVVSKLTKEEQEQGKWLQNISAEELEKKLNDKLRTIPEYPEEIYVNTVQKAAAICSKHGYDPIEAMVEIAKDKDKLVQVRLACHKEIAKYTYSKVKPQDINQKSPDENDNKPVTIIITKYGQNE